MSKAYIVLVGWHGVNSVPVEIIGETPKRYRVKMLCDAYLPVNRMKRTGDVVLVPKTAIRREPVTI